MRIANRTFTREDGAWIKVEWTHGDMVSYNTSGGVQWTGGRLQCTRQKFEQIIERGGYS